ncbi:MAG: CHAT domain-containing protein [Roseofilum sp. SBFL]|uniref:CHAT domain-containing protein n=1 Tax=Roseofilum sp. SBFL TaxID=2821496 RepID=UPI001B0077C6|nr:CHAT domain-containing tetratricopeptide repeat protein [Roseofilum sp. SBFL]MBP0042416.1 CHAT domain-containing protein [Roseofilum sp. SBFL]
MSDSNPEELTPQEQIYALQHELIQVREKGGDRTPESAADPRSAECEVLGKLGVAYYQGQQWQEALVTLTEYLNLARELGQQWQEAVAQYYLGFTQQRRGDIWSAVEAFCQAYWLWRLFSQDEFCSQVWQQVNQAVDLYVNAKDSEKLNRLLAWQLQVAEAWKDAGLKGDVLANIGRIQYNNHALQEAVVSYSQMLGIAEALPDDRRKSLALAWLGCSYRELGQLEQSLEYFDRRLVVAQELGDRAAQQETLVWLIDISQRCDQFDSTFKYYQVQLALFEEIEEPIAVQGCLYNLASLQFNRQQYQEALSGFEAALQKAESLEDDGEKSARIANSRYMLGQCYSNLDQKESAISAYQQAVELYGELGIKTWLLSGLDYLVKLHRELGQDEQAIDCLKHWLELFRQDGDRTAEQSCLYNIGNLYDNLKQWGNAIEYFELDLQLARDLGETYKQGNAHYMLGKSYGRLQQFPKAIDNYEQAINLYQDVKDIKWAASSSHYLGNLYYYNLPLGKAESIEKAIEIYTENLSRYTRVDFPKDWAMTQNTLGNAYCDRILGNKAENLETAISYYEAVLEVYTREDFYQEWIRIYKNLGMIYRNRVLGEKAKNLEQAIAYERATQKVNISYSDPIFFLESQEGQALAISYYKNVLEICNREAAPKKWAATQYNMGNAYLKSIEWQRWEDIEQAIFCYESALQVYNRNDHPQDWASSKYKLGVSYYYRIRGVRADNLEQALAAYQCALSVYTREEFSQSWARTQINLGALYSDRIREDKAENLEKALTAYNAALEILNREQFPQDWAGIKHNLGNAYAKRIIGQEWKNKEDAIIVFQSALEIYNRNVYPQQWAMTQNDLGSAYYYRIRGERADNLEEAIAAYQLALEVRTREAFPADWAGTKNNLAAAYSDRIKGERADNQEKAIAAYELALKVYTREAFPEQWATTQNNLGTTYHYRIKGDRAHNLEQAIAAYQASLEVSTRNAFPRQHLGTLNDLGFAYQAQSQNYTSNSAKKQIALANAYKAFEQALDTVEYLRGEITSGDEAQRKLNEEWTRLYFGMVEVCLELGRDADAIQYVDRSKARNLTELIATRDAYPGAEIPAEVRQRLQQLRQAISEEDRRLKQDPNPDYTHIRQLREEFQAKYPYKPLKFSDIQSLLDNETVILEWYVLDDKFLTFTLTKHSLNLWTSSQKDLDNLIDWFNAYLNDYRNNKTQWQHNLPQRLEQLAQILHLDEILQNLRDKFPNCQKLILIPHRFLHLFPLHALPIATGENERQTLQELFSKGVNYSPNCQVLKQAKKRINERPDFDQLFAIQNPTNDLDFTDIEVEAIQSYFNPHHILKHEEAEKTALNLNTAHCNHFSCHGYFNFNNPLQSALLLAKSIFPPPPPKDDQTRYLPLENGNFLDLNKCLTLEDILRLDLTKCRLVTLSACETGITDFTSSSDEYIGLPSGFILAGSPNVVSSLWAVNDLSTALLMIRFYQNLKNGETVRLALREAQIWLRDATVEALQVWSEQTLDPFSEDELRCRLSTMDSRSKPFASPYYWAGFCAIGA